MEVSSPVIRLLEMRIKYALALYSNIDKIQKCKTGKVGQPKYQSTLRCKTKSCRGYPFTERPP